MSAISYFRDGFIISLYVQSKACNSKIIGLYRDKIKIAITAPSINGQANAELIKFLAKEFKVAKSNVIIEKGARCKYKQVRIFNLKHAPSLVVNLYKI
ncbi:hypothetical protein SCc_021 [Serratia symbiotica str. 'Cinara cedri']|nr:hypothetical protein SCc_021 [Serratia symbiotica str. 'Cinara cedri']